MLEAWLACALLLACAQPIAPGTPCAHSSECGAPLVCAYGRCRAQCRLNADCPAGQTCLVGTSGVAACSLDTDLGCETGVGRACPSGLTCAADRCLATCASPADCPSDGTCASLPGTSVSVCVDPRSTPDGGALDAAAADASAADAGAGHGVVTDLCVGDDFACVLIDGGVRCWGGDYYGQLGDGVPCATAAVSSVAVQVQTQAGVALDGVDALACGGAFACAHRTTGELRCWGRDDFGQLGDGGSASCVASAARVRTSASTPLVLPSPVSLAAAGEHACVLSGSTAYCWGRDSALGIPGAGALDADVPYATMLEAARLPAGTTRLALVVHGACAIDASNSVACWGANEDARLGAGASVPIAYDVVPDPPGALQPMYVATAPVPVSGLADVRSVAIGGDFGCALTGPTHVLACWGDDDARALGLIPGGLPDCGGNCSAAPFVLDLAEMRFARVVSWGDARTVCGVEASGQVQCWGSNEQGQAGLDPATSVLELGASPNRIALGSTAATLVIGEHLAVGGENVCATTPGNQGVVCWGAADVGVTGHVSTTPEPTAQPITL